MTYEQRKYHKTKHINKRLTDQKHKQTIHSAIKRSKHDEYHLPTTITKYDKNYRHHFHTPKTIEEGYYQTMRNQNQMVSGVPYSIHKKRRWDVDFEAEDQRDDVKVISTRNQWNGWSDNRETGVFLTGKRNRYVGSRYPSKYGKEGYVVIQGRKGKEVRKVRGSLNVIDQCYCDYRTGAMKTRKFVMDERQVDERDQMLIDADVLYVHHSIPTCDHIDCGGDRNARKYREKEKKGKKLEYHLANCSPMY
eukprot:TRINITY_DN1697_c0_g1_i2.p1 TRINITY_DN1697_c0_g1~~TRINITY_DN1697_c0_g1_i2.p1  ORF type:complete len:249 (-),score=43.20 TRINITY_DN1697_c0_g1_i2:92-838(-)